jgi:hypothetical protein
MILDITCRHLESNYSWSRPQSLFAANAARLTTHQRPEL